MKPLRRNHAGYTLVVALALLLGPIVLSAAEPFGELDGADYQLLANPSLEYYDGPYGQYAGIDCQLASYWQRFWYDGPEPAWMDTRVFAASYLGCGWVEAIDGQTSQLVTSTEPYTAGLWQQVTGLTPGIGYGFHAALLTIYETSDQPPVDGTMVKQVGIDPTGGTDPCSPNIVWSEPNDRDQAWDLQRRVSVFAQGPTATVFIRVISPYPTGGLPLLNHSFLDSAIMAQTGSVGAVSPPVSTETEFTVRWDNAVPSPEGQIRYYDVQWSDADVGAWHDWKHETEEVSAFFTGEQGHTYRFRARVWQRYPNGAYLVSPYREAGDTETRIGTELRGRVLGPEGQSIAGATVAVVGSGYQATSGAGGEVTLGLPPLAGPQTVTVTHPAWLAPAPVYGLEFGPTESVVLTWTLRPADDVQVNGGFEDGLAGWRGTAGGTRPVTDTVHSGTGAAALGGTKTASLSQTVELNGAWEPALSFWYWPESMRGDLQFDVLLTVVSPDQAITTPLTQTTPVTTTQEICTPPAGEGNWQHFWCYAGPRDAPLTGTVTVDFRLRGEGQELVCVLLDEVSLGSTPGGPFKAFLPLVVRLLP